MAHIGVRNRISGSRESHISSRRGLEAKTLHKRSYGQRNLSSRNKFFVCLNVFDLTHVFVGEMKRVDMFTGTLTVSVSIRKTRLGTLRMNTHMLTHTYPPTHILI